MMRYVLFLVFPFLLGGCLSIEESFAQQVFSAIQNQNDVRIKELMIPADVALKMEGLPDNADHRNNLHQIKNEVINHYIELSNDRGLSQSTYVNYSLVDIGNGTVLYLKYILQETTDSIGVDYFNADHLHFIDAIGAWERLNSVH